MFEMPKDAGRVCALIIVGWPNFVLKFLVVARVSVKLIFTILKPRFVKSVGLNLRA